MTYGNWHTLADFTAPSNAGLIERLAQAVNGLELPEAYLKRLGQTLVNAVQAARQREPESQVNVQLLVAQAHGGQHPCWGCFRLERVIAQPARHTEIQVFLFPEH